MRRQDRPRSPYFFLIYLSPVLITCLGLAIVVFMRAHERGLGGERSLGEDSYREVMQIIEENYVTDVDRDELIYGALNGMAEVLDRHSRGYDEKEWQTFQRSSRGDSAGIGIRFGLLNGIMRVLYVFPKSPAARSGLRAGDRIFRVDGNLIETNATAAFVKNLVVGPMQSLVRFEVETWGSQQKRQLEVKRGVYRVPSLLATRLGKKKEFGYFHLSGFNENSAVEFRKALQAMTSEGLEGLILDLRENPGGALQAAVDVVASVLQSDCVLRSVYRKFSKTYPTEGGLVSRDLPMTVLINGNSASASEIVAGALQDYKRALLVGEGSYGKGVVQKVYPLQTRPAGLKITTARWLTPSGRTIQRTKNHEGAQGGIQPDLVVKLSKRDQQKLAEFWDRIPMNAEIRRAIAADDNYLKLEEDWLDPQLTAALRLLRRETTVVKVTP